MRKEIDYPLGNYSLVEQVFLRAHSAKRHTQAFILRRLMEHFTLGGPGWHLVQATTSRWSSVSPDWQLRSELIGNSLVSCGSGLCIFPDVTLHYPRNLTIGRNVFMNRGVVITAPAKVTIGDDVLIGPHVIINSGNHRYVDPGVPIRLQGHKLDPIVIEDDVWIGAHSVILPGVRVGRSSVVGAGAVVTRDVPPDSVVGGVPARIIKHRRASDPRVRRIREEILRGA